MKILFFFSFSVTLSSAEIQLSVMAVKVTITLVLSPSHHWILYSMGASGTGRVNTQTVFFTLGPEIPMDPQKSES